MAKSKNLNEISYQFIDLYNYGFSSRDIAKLYGIAKTSVLNHLKKEKVNLESNSNKYNKDTEDKIIKLYLKGYIRSEISAELGISFNTVTRYLKDLVSINSKFENLKPNIFNDYKKGFSISEISENYNISRGSVHSILHNMNSRIRDLEESGRKHSINAEYFESNLSKEKLNQLAIFIKYGSIYRDEIGHRLRLRTSEHREDLIYSAINGITSDDYNIFKTDSTLNFEIRSKAFCKSLSKLGMTVNTNINFDKIKCALNEEQYEIFINEFNLI